MNKIYMRKRQVIILVIIVILLILFAIVSIIISIIKDDSLIAIFGIITTIVFEMIFVSSLIIVYKQKLIIDKDRIIIYYKTFSSYKEYRGFNIKGMEIKFKDICYIEIIKAYGDGLFIADTRFVIFHLKNKKSFEASFFHYGKYQEKEIISILWSINKQKKDCVCNYI